MMDLKLNPGLFRLRNALPMPIKTRADFIAAQMKDGRVSPSERCKHLLQLRFWHPLLTRKQSLVVAIYILVEAGLLKSRNDIAGPSAGDLSAIVSKYIGATERDLDALFAELQMTGTILLFDQASSLFGSS